MESEKEYKNCEQKYFLLTVTHGSDRLLHVKDIKILHPLSKTGCSLQLK